MTALPKQESAVRLEPMAADVQGQQGDENQAGAVYLGEDEEETGVADPVSDHFEDGCEGGYLIEFRGQPTIQGVANEAQEVRGRRRGSCPGSRLQRPHNSSRFLCIQLCLECRGKRLPGLVAVGHGWIGVD